MVQRNGSTQSQNSGDWRSKVHQVEFTQPQLESLKVLVEADSRSIGEVLLDLVTDNLAIKFKAVDHYSSYTISITLPKDDPVAPSHTYWYYDTDLLRGVRVASAVVSELLWQIRDEAATKKPMSLW